jgi:hypothetical protein
MKAMLTVTNRPLSEALNAIALSDEFNVVGISTHRIYADN